ncbi:MAG: heavy metal translocating P-type ATPase [Lentisphaeria bacterium]|nr:heavy metal translocating P-type ATPase [Lentisphaeria bacterium]
MSEHKEHHHNHGSACGCGHDHSHNHNHTAACGCGHDHHHDEPTRCISCGAPMGEGAGHGRSMGRIGFAVIGGFLIINHYLLGWLMPELAFAASLSAFLGAVILALPIVLTAVKDLCEGRVYMNELVALAILAAFTSAEFSTAGLIAFFLLVTIIIESHTASGAQRSIEDLIRLAPHTAQKLVDGKSTEVEVSSLVIGDVINVRPGDNFPVDGVVIRGQSAVNQASITGESLPIDKIEGDEVYAGTQNLSSSLDVRITKLGADTTLGKVRDMILSAERSKTPIVRIIDKYAGFYTPTIMMLAIITWWLSGGDMTRVITLLVIACPCAVVLATPTATVAAVAAAARLGILIKNVSHLELAAKIRAFVFDKTGTLTEGELAVAKLGPTDGIEPAQLLQIAASVEAHSKHPTALAIQKLAQEVGIKMLEINDFKETPGTGVEALVDGKTVLVGRALWLKRFNVVLPETQPSESTGMSVVYVAQDGKLIGWIGFRDKIRAESAEAIHRLKEQGVTRCSMVTGDRETVAAGVAEKLNIDDFKGDCLPEGKVEYIEELKKSTLVAFVGDGVNDAPALAAGDLSIAMGAIGSDIAINSASIALMTNDLRRIPMLVSLSKKSNSITNQNVAFGLLFVLCGIILSVFGWMGPIAAAVLHTLSTLIIIFNSARLLRAGEEATTMEAVSWRRGLQLESSKQ